MKNAESLVKIGQSLSTDSEGNIKGKLKVLNELIKPDFLYVATFEEGQKPKSYCLLRQGRVMQKIEYALPLHPCENIMLSTTAIFPKNVQAEFPEDMNLKHLDIEGFAGTPLLSKRGNPIGVLAAMYKTPIKNPERIKALLQIFSRPIEKDLNYLASLVSTEDLKPKSKKVFSDSWKKFLEHSLDEIPGVFYAKSLEGNFIHVNQEFLNLNGLKRSEVIGKSAYDLFSKKVANKQAQSELDILEGIDNLTFEEDITNANGTKKKYRSYKFPYFNPSGDIFATGGLSIDISKEKIMEKELEEEKLKTIQASKLASLGEMAAGIAHEINNPLAIIKGYSQKLRKDFERGNTEKALKGISKINETVDRIDKIIKGLRAFARDSHYEEMEFVSLEHIVQTSRDLIEERLKNNGVSLKIEGNLEHIIQVRLVNITQVLINLMTNSFHAVYGAENPWVKIEVSSPTKEGLINIYVSDSGDGISQDVVKKMFEPFFTTKGSSEGTGLGLSICRSILKDHQGSLNYMKKDGHTCFVMTLPVVCLGQ